MPAPAMTASVGNACHAPMSTCNSATNPLKPGSPIEATLAMTNVTAANGIALAQIHPFQRRQLARVRPVINHPPDHGEQQPGNDAVREHLQHRAAQADGIQRHQTQQHETHVAHARIADDEFEILLHQRHHRAVHDADDRQHRDTRARVIPH